MDALECVVEAVLYEGYVLWPYRRSANKNRHRWTFGGVYPPAFVAQAASGDVSRVQTQCLVTGEHPQVDVELRFLHVVARRLAQRSDGGELHFVDALNAGSRRIFAWDEARERRIARTGEFVIEQGEEREEVDGGVIVRNWEEVRGNLDVNLERAKDDVWRVTAVVSNASAWNGADRALAQRHGLMSAHVVLRVRGGAFVSMTDPPAELVTVVTECRNRGLWPVLVADEQTMLASPIILYDYPQVAVESPGLLFDSSEIDQLLILNTQVLTDDEKDEVRATDPRVSELLERAEAFSAADSALLWGRLLRQDARPESVTIGGAEVRPGTRVRLHPQGRADVFDIVLNGQIATVESIEQDFEERIRLAVTLEDDPGRDLGMARLPGHRFFFSPSEVEPVG